MGAAGRRRIMAGGPFYRSNGSLVDFDCDSFSSPYTWTDADGGTGISTQETFDGRNTFKMLGGTNNGSNNAGRAALTGITYPDDFTVTIIHYIDIEGNSNQRSAGYYFVYNPTGIFAPFFFDGELRINKGGGSFNNTGITFETDEWQEWTFKVYASTPATATCDIYKNRVLILSGEDGSWVSSGQTEGNILNYAWASQVFPCPFHYTDKIMIGDGLVEV